MHPHSCCILLHGFTPCPVCYSPQTLTIHNASSSKVSYFILSLPSQQIVLAGGSCKLPQLRYLLIGKFPNAQHHTSLPPESVAVLGCAQEAGILTRFHGKQIQLLSDKSYIPCTSNDLWIIVSYASFHLYHSFRH